MSDVSSVPFSGNKVCFLGSSHAAEEQVHEKTSSWCRSLQCACWWGRLLGYAFHCLCSTTAGCHAGGPDWGPCAHKVSWPLTCWGLQCEHRGISSPSGWRINRMRIHQREHIGKVWFGIIVSSDFHAVTLVNTYIVVTIMAIKTISWTMW